MLHQLDINNAFFHAHLDEHVYLKPPNGYEGAAGKVCKLKKSLYGLNKFLDIGTYNSKRCCWDMTSTNMREITPCLLGIKDTNA